MNGSKALKVSIGKAWDETVEFLRREGRLVAPVALATFALPSILLNWAYPAGSANSAGGIASLILLVILVAVMTGQMTIIKLATGWRGSIGEALGKAARRVPTLLGAVLVIFGPLIVLFSIALGVVLAASGVSDPAALTPETMVKVPGVAWMALLMLAAAIFLSVRLFPMTAIAANEQVGPIGLLKRSWALTSRQFGRLLVALLMLVLAAVVLSSAVSIVVGSLTALLIGAAHPFTLAALLIALAGGIVSALISSVSAAMIGRIYVQLSGEPAAA